MTICRPPSPGSCEKSLHPPEIGATHLRSPIFQARSQTHRPETFRPSGVKIYTKTGDDGTTGLFGGGRVKKTDARVEAYGTVDELNSSLGIARSLGLDAWVDGEVGRIQSELFVLGAELACVPGKESKMGMGLLDEIDSKRLEDAIDRAEEPLPALKNFVLPGGSAQAAHLHLARTICRRAERGALELEGVRGELIIYLNRLSDLLFTLARYENHVRKVEDVPWAPRKEQSPAK